MPSSSAYRHVFAAGFLTLCGIVTLVSAQDFRVHTTVTDQSHNHRMEPSISLTLFHAGKVYDYLQSLDETVISEPTHNRFLILSKRHDLSTQITPDEIRRFLGLAQTHARELIEDWQRQGEDRQAAIRALEFQLFPEFEVRHDEKAKTLTLLSQEIRYDVTYAAPPSPEIAITYLKSADWTAQLNSVLHPHALLPPPRLRLNDELRKRRVIPVEVNLQINGEHPVHLRARHEWTWKLLPIDRRLIDVWESQSRPAQFRSIPFQDFQQQTLTASTSKR